MHNLQIQYSTNFHAIIQEMSFAMTICSQTQHQIFLSKKLNNKSFYEVINKLHKQGPKT